MNAGRSVVILTHQFDPTVDKVVDELNDRGVQLLSITSSGARSPAPRQYLVSTPARPGTASTGSAVLPDWTPRTRDPCMRCSASLTSRSRRQSK